jgi:hypothetical protein
MTESVLDPKGGFRGRTDKNLLFKGRPIDKKYLRPNPDEQQAPKADWTSVPQARKANPVPQTSVSDLERILKF